MKKYLLLLIAFFALFTSFAQARPHFSIGINLPIITGCAPSYGCAPRYYPSYAVTSYPYCAPVYVPSYLQTSPPVYTVPATPIYVSEPRPVVIAPSQNLTVVQVQTILKQRKYYNGIIDGAQGPATTSAIRTYQTDRNLTPTGRIDSVLLNDLGL